MEVIVRSTKLEEFKDTINLINEVFRTTINEKPTMKYEFPLLLNESNVENMIVALDSEKIVSSVNYLIQDVLIEGQLIKVGFIGAVCTNSQYEGKGYASKVLDFVEEKMKKDGVDVISISGTRSLYTRRSCSMVKSFYKYTVNKNEEQLDLNLSLKEFKEEDLPKYLQLYNQNSTRFFRSKEQFKILLEAATVPWGSYSYKKLSVKKDNEVIGYVVIRLIEEKNRFGKIIEMEVDNLYKASVLQNIANKYDLDYVIYHVHVKDCKNHFEGYSKRELDYQGGTLKVINFEKLMKSLRNYFNQYVENQLLENLNFREDNNKYIIEYMGKEECNNERLVVEDLDKLNKLLFECDEKNYVEFKDLKNIHKFLEEAFPLNFVWTENLNYQ